MRIVQIVGDMSNPSAGPSYSIARLADELFIRGEDISVLTPGTQPTTWPYSVPLKASAGWLDNHLGVSPKLFRDIRKQAQQSDILHGHSIWRFANNGFPLILGRHVHAKIVCSPRGTLSFWSMRHKSTLKMPFWKFLQRPALERCQCFHVTAPIEYHDIRRLDLRSPVSVIPNGVDVPTLPQDILRKKRVVFLGRIHPVKGLDILIQAWESIACQFRDWELVIAGPLHGAYAETVQRLAKDLNTGRVTFVGELLGEEKQQLFAGASLFVLPSYSENFGQVIAEALAHGLPVITTTETPWEELSARKCGWYVQPELAAVTAAMQAAMSMSLDELHNMGQIGRDWMEKEYSWPRIATMMLETYEWIRGYSHCPGWVIED